MERQRIALARAFFGEPAVVILDEPDAHLDADGRASLVGAIAAHRARGGAAVVVAHHPATFAECAVVYRMEAGALLPMAPAGAPESGPMQAVRVVPPFAGRPPPRPVS